MKKIKIAILLLLFIFGICYLNSRIINSASEKSTEYLNKIEEQNQKENFLQMKEICDEFSNYWDKKSEILSTFVHHDILDEISENISELKSLILYQTKGEISRVINITKTIVKSLAELDNMSLKNIL